ncbi:hypothetical protein H0H87_005083 [Tephrocybe sp. NHM501043]|nr:hypothetical protein H0H87_005083 [Tephrocybe sp. NHM501043]
MFLQGLIRSIWHGACTHSGRMLPQEINDLIVDELCWDRETLLSCTLVSSQWLSRSRHWLFKDFTLVCNTVEGDTHWDDGRILDTFGHEKSMVAPYVRTLDIRGCDHTFEKNKIWASDWEGADFLREEQEKYRDLNALLQLVLPHLANLRSLNLSRITWHNLIAQNREYIQSMPSLTSLSLEDVIFTNFPELLSVASNKNFPKLNELHINGVMYSEPLEKAKPVDYFALPDPVIWPTVRSLELYVGLHVAPLALLPSRFFHMNKMESLTVSLYHKEWLSDVEKLIDEASGPQLHTLVLGLNPHEIPLTSPMSLTKNVNLQSFGITPKLSCDHIPWLISMIETIPKSTSSVMVTITLNISDMEEDWEHFEFAPLEKALARDDNASSHLLYAELWKLDFREALHWQGFITLALPILEEYGKLMIGYS